MSEIEKKLADMGLELPPDCPSRASYLKYRTWNGLLFLSGQICEWNGTPKWLGPITPETSMEESRKAAQLCALNLLFCTKEALGSLDRVSAVLRVGGFVHVGPSYKTGPAVVDGASRLFIDLFGDAGQHARTAVCVSSLPENAAVEVDAVLAYT